MNTWEYTPETIPPGLLLTDTIVASDHLPLSIYIEVPGPADLDGDGNADLADFSIFASWWLASGCDGDDNWCGLSDINGDGGVNVMDMSEFVAGWL